MKLYQAIARTLQALRNSQNVLNVAWAERHAEDLKKFVAMLPDGSGFDRGTQLDQSKSTADKLVFNTAFHHMDAHGGYAGWTEHTVTVRACLQFDFYVTVSGRNRNDIKEYIADAFNSALIEDVDCF